MAESFEVTTAALYGHAGGLLGLADELRGVLDVAGHVTLTDDAYGQTCRRVASMLDAVARNARDAVQAGVEALESAASGLRDNAETYTGMETSAATTYTGISERLG
jgi:hypothetical protein